MLVNCNECEQNNLMCNCRMKTTYPMEGNCLNKNVVYLPKTKVEHTNNAKEKNIHRGHWEWMGKKDVIIIPWVWNTINMKMRRRCQPITGKIKSVLDKSFKITWWVFSKKNSACKTASDRCRICRVE